MTLALTHLAARLYTRLLLSPLGQQPANLPEAGPHLLVANHPTTFDFIYLAALWPEPIYMLVRDRLFDVPLLGLYLHWGQHIRVDPAHGTAAFRRARRRLEAGHTVLIFPEGDVSPQPERLRPFRSGAARLAMLTGAPVIPIGLYVPHRTSLGPCQNCYLWGPYGVTVGQPLYFSGDKTETVATTAHLQQMVEALVVESRHRVLAGRQFGKPRKKWGGKWV